MKLIIAGGRYFVGRQKHLDWLNELEKEQLGSDPIEEVISGCALGADTFGSCWANSRGIPVKEFRPEWHKHGKSAGPIRNQEMAEYADAVVLFPGEKGTEHMYTVAKKKNLIIYDWRDRK